MTETKPQPKPWYRRSSSGSTVSTPPVEVEMESELSLDDLSLLQPGTVSITIFKEPFFASTKSIGPFLLAVNAQEEIEICAISSGNDTDCLIPKRLSSLPLLREGNVLESINQVSCEGKPLWQVENLLEQTTGKMTLVFKRPEASSYSAAIRQAVVIQPESERESPNTQATISRRVAINNGLEFSMHQPKRGEQRLRVASIQQDSCLSESCLESGDIVLSLNGNLCHGMDPNDAQLLFQAKSETASYVSILAYHPASPTTSVTDRVRKTAVAVSGGALIGTGAIIMATPLHPVGHAMAIGGAGVLSTEFEGPRRAMQGFKQRLNGNSKRQIEAESSERQLCS